MKEVQLKSTITCLACGGLSEEVMPTNACQWYYECQHCHAMLTPEKGDCCVFCSYGTVPCPPIQNDDHCCSNKHAEKITRE